MVTCNFGTAQFEEGTIKCQKKNMSTIECGKNIVIYDVGTT